MSDPSDDEAERAEGNRLMVTGVALGAVGAASAVLLGATCPLCVVGAPALVGWGAYKRWNASQREVEGGPAGGPEVTDR
jgi:hypothetical protein